MPHFAIVMYMFTTPELNRWDLLFRCSGLKQAKLWVGMQQMGSFKIKKKGACGASMCVED